MARCLSLQFYVDIPAVLCTNTINIKFSLNNYFKTSFTLLAAKGTGSQDGTEYATFDHTFVNKFTTNAGQTPGDYSELLGLPERSNCRVLTRSSDSTGEQLPAKFTRGTLGTVALLSEESQKKGIDLVRTFGCH